MVCWIGDRGCAAAHSFAVVAIRRIQSPGSHVESRRRCRDRGVSAERRCPAPNDRGVEIRLVDRQLLGDEVEDVAAGAGHQPVAADADRRARPAEHEVRSRRSRRRWVVETGDD